LDCGIQPIRRCH